MASVRLIIGVQILVRGFPLMRQLRAFTLIELLIVVAIIAILAAIAVPNFLEAQTRAKVSRVRADIRTVATGLESYAVDNNKYPVPKISSSPPAYQLVGGRYSAAQFLPGGQHLATGNGLAIGLTSPIAYLSTSKLKDVFAVGRFDEEHNDISYQNIDYWYDPGVIGAEYGNPTNLTSLDNTTGIPKGYFKTIYGPYKVGSIGPDQDYDGGRHPYDSTNGTISSGDIFRTQIRTEGGGDNRT
jgi:prepilin-type N-terminal cleavage/methylation domain-containing protein